MRGEFKLAGHLVQYGRRTRRSYARINEVLEVPNLIEIQQNLMNGFGGRTPRNVPGHLADSGFHR